MYAKLRRRKFAAFLWRRFLNCTNVITPSQVSNTLQQICQLTLAFMTGASPPQRFARHFTCNWDQTESYKLNCRRTEIKRSSDFCSRRVNLTLTDLKAELTLFQFLTECSSDLLFSPASSFYSFLFFFFSFLFFFFLAFLWAIFLSVRVFPRLFFT